MTHRLPLVLVGVLIVMTFGIGLVAYPYAPDELPIHWDLRGQADSWAPKEFALFVVPMMMVPLAGILYAAIRWTMPGVTTLGLWNLVALLFAHLILQASLAAPAFGYQIAMSGVVLVVLGIIELALGLTAPRLPPNVSMGIRLPWTLDNEEVWTKTHRIAGPMLVIGAVVLFVGAAIGIPMWIGLLVGTAGPLLGAVAASYVVWRRHGS